MSELSETGPLSPALSRANSLSATQATRPPLSRPPTSGNTANTAGNKRPGTAVASKNGDQCNVQVVVRLRPQNERERREGEAIVTSVTDATEVHVHVGNAPKTGVKVNTTKRTFTFDTVFAANIEQAELYDRAVKPLVDEVLAGFNCTVFAYGQTGTGKV